ncbi:MAG: hypothetical protein PHG67_13740 [Bacteroidales bacterium]|jgi:hypothetical protein|nr:hypothetical protein [Bacteroidales bacterium]
MTDESKTIFLTGVLMLFLMHRLKKATERNMVVYQTALWIDQSETEAAQEIRKELEAKAETNKQSYVNTVIAHSRQYVRQNPTDPIWLMQERS